MMEKIIEKIRKLRIHAESAQALGSTAEAIAFMEKAEALMQEHNLTLEELTVEEALKVDPVNVERFRASEFGLKDTAKRQMWVVYVLHSVARLFHCECYSGMGNRICLIGKESDRKAASFVGYTVVRFAEQRSIRDYENHKANGGDEGRFYRRDWFTGFIKTIDDRVYDILAVREQESVSSRGIILWDSVKHEIAKLKPDNVRALHSSTHSSFQDYDAVLSGREAAEEANLAYNALGHSTPSKNIG